MGSVILSADILNTSALVNGSINVLRNLTSGKEILVKYFCLRSRIDSRITTVGKDFIRKLKYYLIGISTQSACSEMLAITRVELFWENTAIFPL